MTRLCRCSAGHAVSITDVSRILWVGVGAAGGIYAYRKTTRAIEEVRGRTFRENMHSIARTASSVAASARYLAATSGRDETAAELPSGPARAEAQGR